MVCRCRFVSERVDSDRGCGSYHDHDYCDFNPHAGQCAECWCWDVVRVVAPAVIIGGFVAVVVISYDEILYLSTTV